MDRFVLSTMLLLIAAPLLAQTPSLEPGTRLRVHTQGLKLSGEFVRWEGDTLVVRPEITGRNPGSRIDHALAMSEVRRLDRNVPRSHGRGAARGVLWGGVIGAVLGAGIGAVQETNCFLCPSSHMEGALIGAAALGGLGAGVGALVGAIAPGTRWEPVELPASDAWELGIAPGDRLPDRAGGSL